MDRYASFTHRLQSALPLLTGWFGLGLVLAAWSPHPRFILTVALGTSAGVLVLGPYAAAALYSVGLRSTWRAHLRWALCLILALSTVLLLHYLLGWEPGQLLLAGGTAVAGTVLGHDATLAVLELRGARRLDRGMVVLFPFLLGLSALAGYASLGFGVGLYRFVSALSGAP